MKKYVVCLVLGVFSIGCGETSRGGGDTDQNLDPDASLDLDASTANRDAKTTPDASVLDPDAAQGGCGSCGEGQVCEGSRCVDVPKMCPCPTESYCDLATDTCVVGCFDDEGCASGRICEGDRCQNGCRVDEDCGAGQICENLQCRAGCRDHDSCGDDEVCEASSLTCRAGCLAHDACPLGQVCSEGLTCVSGCNADTRCPEDTICEQDACRAGCRTASDCDDREICNQETFACEPFASSNYCNRDYDCQGSTAGNRCDLTTHLCSYSPREVCDSSLRCGEGKWCNPNSFQCYPYRCGGGSCGSGFECKYDADAYPYKYYCGCTGTRCSLEAECTDDTQCPYSAKCQDSKCVPYFRLECETDDDCPGTYIKCNPAIGMCTYS